MIKLTGMKSRFLKASENLVTVDTQAIWLEGGVKPLLSLASSGLTKIKVK